MSSLWAMSARRPGSTAPRLSTPTSPQSNRWLGTQDVCIGIADSGRRDEHTWTGVGPFLNMLPVRIGAKPEQTLADAMLEARKQSLAALINTVPLEVILNELQVARHATHTPLAQTFLNYAETSVESGREFLGCRWRWSARIRQNCRMA